MWTEQFEYMLMLVVMAALLRTSYELARSDPNKPASMGSNPRSGLTPQQEEWAEKAARKYAEAQGKKWRNWNEAMFERSG